MNLTNLFNHQTDKKGFVTVMNVLLKNVQTKEPMLKLDSLKISNINVEGSEKEIRGGLGAGLLMTYGYGRTATVEIEDAFASMESLQYLFGAVDKDSSIQYTVYETVAADADGQSGLVLTFNQTTNGIAYALPGNTNLASVVVKADDAADMVGALTLAKDTTYVIEDGQVILIGAAVAGAGTTHEYIEITYDTNPGATYSKTPVAGTVYGRVLSSAGVLNESSSIDNNGIISGANPGDVVEVYYETIKTADTTTRGITLRSTDFPEAVKLVGHTFLVNEADGKKVLCEIEIPKFKLDPSFNFSLEGEGDASTFNFTGKALESSNNEIFKLKFIGEFDTGAPIK